jgi:GTP pyrophosphokinase
MSISYEDMKKLKELNLAPYMYLATALIGKARRSGGNMFRHQLDTMAILIDYGYIDSTLLKASIIHDLVEDIPEYNRNVILSVDYESPAVYELVLEVTKIEGEGKSDFLTRVKEKGSRKAKILKCADRISNMISLGYVTDISFVKRYTDETMNFIYPIAADVDKNMLFELQCLVDSRRKFLKDASEK